ncbi:unnamed protein product [Linum trigynum]|uniref:Uncharacterized protein n=1 Tax=Linum trigynum TaxID=586398 RepID=A0AAV2GPT0_9ROSI
MEEESPESDVEELTANERKKESDDGLLTKPRVPPLARTQQWSGSVGRAGSWATGLDGSNLGSTYLGLGGPQLRGTEGPSVGRKQAERKSEDGPEFRLQWVEEYLRVEPSWASHGPVLGPPRYNFTSELLYGVGPR